MTRLTRRSVLRSTTTGLGLAGLVVPVQGKSRGNGRANGRGNGRNGGDGSENGGGKTSLLDGPAEFKLYVGTGDDPSTPGAFEYPGSPPIAGEDPVGGIFDAGQIEKTPNGQTLHHVFRLFQGLLIRKDRGKPYVLVHDGNGRYTERGQHLNFEARSSDELKAALSDAGLNPALADEEPFSTLTGGKWRAVGNDVVQLLGDPAESRRLTWAVTRVDFYSRGGGPPTFEFSALYVIYPNVDENGEPEPADPSDPTLQPIPTATDEASRSLIADGRANLGGQ